MKAEEERELLRRIETRLREIEARLERLEAAISPRKLGGSGFSEEELAAEALALILRLFRFGGSALEAAKAVRRLARARVLARCISDSISRAILEVIAIKGPLNISTLTLELRRYRGRASRRIVSARVREMAEKGLVKVTVKGREKVVDLPD